MLKQFESVFFSSSTRLSSPKYLLILGIAFLLQKQLQAQTPDLSFPMGKESTTAGTLTHLDTLIPGPYTQEAKKEILKKKLPEIVRTCIPKLTVSPQDLFCIGPACHEFAFSGITYNEFIAWKHQCDYQRTTQKNEFLSLLKPLGYTTKEAYILFQEISRYTHDRSTTHVYTFDTHFFTQLIAIANRYDIDPKAAMDERVKNKKGPQKKDESLTSYPPEWATHNLYRAAPQTEKTRYGNISVSVKRYDRKTAADFLTSRGYSFWSTNLQDAETGESYNSGSTSVEGFTQDLLDGLQTLIKLITTKKGSVAHLVINGGSEGYDHWMGDHIMAGTYNPSLTLLPKHTKAHGAGYTVDIRLSTEDVLYLKTLFPKDSGKKQYGNSIYIYDYHGAGSSLHLHMHIFSKETYTKLFSAH